MDLATHFRVIVANWIRIVVISLILAVLVFAYSSTKPNVYKANEILTVNIGSSVQGGQATVDQVALLTQTYATYATSPSVLRDGLRRSGLKVGLGVAAPRVSAGQVAGLGFLRISATGPNTRQATALCAGVADALQSQLQTQQNAAIQVSLIPIAQQRAQLLAQLQNVAPTSPDAANINAQLDALNQSEAAIRAAPINRVTVLAGAVAGSSPVSPKPSRDALLAFLTALVVVAELTVLAHAVGDRFSKSEDSAEVTKATGLPVLAKIPRGSGFEVIEAFRVLRTNLMVLEGAGKPRTVAVVSANTDAGKTFTAVHLAQSAAALDEKVVLVDSDLRKPAVHERLGVARQPGLSNVLQGGDLAGSLRKVPDTPFLRVLPSGEQVHDASGVLGARAFRGVLDALRAVRLVVVDTPPVTLFADAMAVASQCDATIFVLDVKTSRRRQVKAALDQLDRAGANLIGVVVNRASTPRRASYYES